MADIKLVGNGDLSWNSGQSDYYVELERFQAVASGVLKSIRVYSGNACAVKVAIYADSSGSPGALLAAVNTATSCVNGWNTINISDVTILSGSYYWLAHTQQSGTGRVQGKNSGGNCKYTTATFSTFTFPDPAGSGYASESYTWALAGWGAESSGSAVIPLFMNQYRQRWK